MVTTTKKEKDLKILLNHAHNALRVHCIHAAYGFAERVCDGDKKRTALPPTAEKRRKSQPYQGGVGLKSHGMTVAVIPMMCLGNRLCRGKL